jgi:hypothetical protein
MYLEIFLASLIFGFLFLRRVKSMRIKIIILALVSFVLWESGYCAENIYTWRDKNGVLNITDYAPPPGAEILEISPSYRNQAEEYWRQRRLQQERIDQAAQQKTREEQAAAARKKEAEARQRADQPQESAQETKDKKSPVKKKGGY